MERELQKFLSQSFGQETNSREIHSASVQIEGKPELPTCEEVKITVQFVKSNKSSSGNRSASSHKNSLNERNNS
jgi:hypothetical protein